MMKMDGTIVCTMTQAHVTSGSQLAAQKNMRLGSPERKKSIPRHSWKDDVAEGIQAKILKIALGRKRNLAS